MADYKVGFGRPPVNYQYPPGKSGNSQGRPKLPKHEPPELAAMIISALDGPIEYHEDGKKKVKPGDEFVLRPLIHRAVHGDVEAISVVLNELIDAMKDDGNNVERYEIRDWIRDYPGQTAKQKTQEFAARNAMRTADWWNNTSPDSV